MGPHAKVAGVQKVKSRGAYMKLFNNHSGLRGLPRFAEGIHWATGLSLTTPFTEGCLGANEKASGCHQEQAPKQRCTFSRREQKAPVM